MNRKDGLYKVKFNGEWVLAKWVTNHDIDSSWSCWWIEGVEPKAWGWTDSDFEEIDETPFNGKLNGCYDSDFKDRQRIVRELIEVHGFSRDKVKTLIGDIIDKMCGTEKNAEGKYFWYCW